MLLDEWISENLEAYLAQAVGTVTTVLAAAVPKTEDPPRLAAAINHSKCAPPPDGAGIKNTFDPATQLITASIAEETLSIPKPESIIAIIRWIDGRARNMTWDEVWESQEPTRTTWPQSDALEEQWARHFEQLFLGVNFSSPSLTYGLEPGGEGSPVGEGWHTYVYGRIQQESRWVFERPATGPDKPPNLATWGSCNVTSWQHPEPTSELPFGNWHETGGPYEMGTVGPLESNGRLVANPRGPRWIAFPNQDPASPIACGCQHLCTFGSLTRGFRIEHVGYHGFQAGMSNAHLPFYRDPRDPNARWTHAYGQYDVPILEKHAHELGSWGRWTPVSQVVAPVLGQATDVVFGSSYVVGKNETVTPPRPGGFPRMVIPPRPSFGHCLTVVRLRPRATQVDSRLQVMDTNCPSSESPPAVFEAGTDDSRSDIGRPTGPHRNTPVHFGIGTPPPLNPGAMIPHLATVRPIGLMRLVISYRTSLAAVHNLGKPLYISPLSRMYGSATDQNYTIARMLWALRNSPGFTNIKANVVVFAPLGRLAKSMWAFGAREMTLGDFDAKVQKITDDDYTPLMSLGTRAIKRGGLAGTAVVAYESKDLPLTTMFSWASRPKWNESWVTPELEAHRSRFETEAELFSVDAARDASTTVQDASATLLSWLGGLTAGGPLEPTTPPGSPTPPATPASSSTALDELMDSLEDIYDEWLLG